MTKLENKIEQRMYADNDTLIITDPCYFINKEEWSGFCNNECIGSNDKCKEYLMHLGFGECIIMDTGYGDWSNECYDEDNKSLGCFTADAGMVAVVTAHDLLHYSEEAYNKMNDYADKGLVCIIPDYTGDVLAKYSYNKKGSRLAVIEGVSCSDFDFSSMDYDGSEKE